MLAKIEIRFVLPVVRRFFCPPEIPLNIAFPTTVSAHISSPKTYKCIAKKQERLQNIILQCSYGDIRYESTNYYTLRT